MRESHFSPVLFIFLFLFTNVSFGQGLAINSSGAQADSSAVLDLSSTSKGLLVPRMDSSQRVSISNPATGLLVYQINGNKPGFYFYNGTGWVLLGNTSGNTPNTKTKIVYKLASGTADTATVTGNTWTTRELNTVVYDDIGVTLSSNQITLPAGSYEVSAYCVFNNANYRVGVEKIRIRDISSGTTLGISLNSGMSVAANSSAYPAFINNERFTLSATSVIELQYFIDYPSLAGGYNNPGQDEVYAELILTAL